MTEQNPTRRAVATAAAWTVPAVAIAATAPMAAASINNASLAWTGTQSSLLSLHVLDSATLLTAQALVTLPTQLTLTNAVGAITGESATVLITVGRPAGINIPVGRAHGFGVYSYNGAVTPSNSRTATYQSAPIVGQYGFPLTTYTTTTTLTVASNGTLNIPVQFGLAGNRTGISVSLLATFPVTATVIAGGRTFTANSTISVPVGAGIL